MFYFLSKLIGKAFNVFALNHAFLAARRVSHFPSPGQVNASLASDDVALGHGVSRQVFPTLLGGEAAEEGGGKNALGIGLEPRTAR